MEIEVMTSERVARTGKFRQIRVPISQAGDLPRSNILFVILSDETTEDRSRRVIDNVHYERVAEAWGDDKTFLIRRSVGVYEEYYLGEYGYIFQWKRVGDSRAERTPESTHPLVFPVGTLLFTGIMLSQEEWEEALIQFQAEMH